MTLTEEVKEGLRCINDVLFHQLGDRYFDHTLQPVEIDPRGRMKDKNKNRRGTPDTIIRDAEGRQIFIQYTTQERVGNGNAFLKKAEADVRLYFSPKSKTAPEDIHQVIFCHTSEMTREEVERFGAICREFNPACTFREVGLEELTENISRYYMDIVNDFLRVPQGSGQILTPDEFVNRYEGANTHITTRLSNPFVGRTEELNYALDLLSRRDVLVVKGKAGVGKTRFALELCRRFSEMYADYTYYV